MRQVGRLCVGFLWVLFAPSLVGAITPEGRSAVRLPGQQLAAPTHEAPDVCLPGEFERQGALLLGCHELVREFPDTLADIVAAVDGRVPVIALVIDQEDRSLVVSALRARGLKPRAVTFAGVAHNTMWARDYGPILVRHSGGGRAVVDGHYGQLDREHDECVPQIMADCLKLPLWQAPIRIEGGNLLSNGDGLILTTTTIVEDNADQDLDERSIADVLSEYVGARQVVFLEPLVNEPTGHADMFATFTSRQTVVVGAYDPEVDPINAAVLDRNAARLSRIVTSRGRLQVVRVPMPPNDDGIWRTYTNVVYANGVALVPVFRRVDEEGAQQALAAYGALLPGWRITPVDVSDLITLGGALHCIALNLDVAGRLPRFPQPSVWRARAPRPPAWRSNHLSSNDTRTNGYSLLVPGPQRLGLNRAAGVP